MNERAELFGSQPACDEISVQRSVYRMLFIKMLSQMQYGTLVVREGNQQWTFGHQKEPRARMTILDPAAYRKIMMNGSIGAGEAYVEQLWEVDDLTALVRLMVRNMALLDRMERGLAWVLRPVNLISHLFHANSRKGSKQNILAHYDLGNEMYAAFLDPSMMYSSGIYPAEKTTLEEAQEYKLEVLCQRLALKATDRVIEIGSGWGGFALYAASKYGCHVTTTTISAAQFKEAKKRIAAAGLEDRITLLPKDYRDLSGKFDKLISVEMIEAVGHRYLPRFFKQCAKLLKPGGMMAIQAITIADQKYRQYVQSVDFIQRYIFPGGCVPSVSRMVQLIADQTDMVVRQIDDFGLDYARTIADWRQRFQASSPLLEKLGYDERFQRLWEFYLAYCQGGFLERSISVVHLVASRPEYGKAGS